MKIRPLSGPLQEKAINELNENPNLMEEYLDKFKDWLSKQDHLKFKNDDQLLINFLRGSKYSLQRAKEKIDAYYSFRTFAPEIGLDLDPLLPDMQSFLKLGFSLPLPTPKTDPTSPRTFLLHFENYDPDEFTLTSMLKGGLMVISVLFNEDDNLVVSGCNVVFDLKGVQFKTALQTTPIMLKKIVYGFEKAYPFRIKRVYIMNVPKYAEQTLNVLKMLLPKKIAERVHLYNSDNWEAIHKEIPKSSLPTEYGGDAGPIETMKADFKKRVESQRKNLLNENNYYSDESRRMGNQKRVEEVFGLEGSFRQLQVD